MALEDWTDRIERRLIRTENVLKQYEKRFGPVEAAMNRLSWAMSLWGGIITVMLGTRLWPIMLLMGSP